MSAQLTMDEKNNRNEAAYQTFFLILAAVLLSFSLKITRGFFQNGTVGVAGFALLAVSLLCCAAAALGNFRKMPLLNRIPGVRLLGIDAAAKIIGLAVFLNIVVRNNHDLWLRLLMGLGSIAALAYAFLPAVRRNKYALWGVVVLLVSFFLWSGFATLHATARDISDVIVFQRDSSLALIQGRNPYALTFPNIYGAHTDFYGAELMSNKRVNFGFPYFPLGLLWVAPFQWICGDFRYGHALALAVCAYCLIAIGKSRLAILAAALLLFSPVTPYVLQVGWTEPTVAMVFCLAMWALARHPRGDALWLGLMLAAKQYMMLFAPLLALLPSAPQTLSTQHSKWKRFAVASGVALFTVLPFFAWDAPAFWKSVVTLQFHQPFRDDALSFLVLFKKTTGVQPPSLMVFALVALAMGLCLWRTPRTVAGFASAVAFVAFVFFAFNKQAFANYYFFVLAALCCAAVLAHREEEED